MVNQHDGEGFARRAPGATAYGVPPASRLALSDRDYIQPFGGVLDGRQELGLLL